MYVCGQSTCMRGGQRRTCGCWFSLSTIQIWRMELFVRLGDQHLYSVSHLPGPGLHFGQQRTNACSSQVSVLEGEPMRTTTKRWGKVEGPKGCLAFEFV